MRKIWLPGFLLCLAITLAARAQGVCPTLGFRWQSAKTIPTTEAAQQAVVADFNSDGKLDLATYQTSVPGQNLRSVIEIQPGNGQGDFAVSQVLQVPYFTPYFSNPALISGDFNGDGKIDLSLSTPGIFKIWLGNGEGEFGAANDYMMGNGPLITPPFVAPRVLVADLDGDGRSDVFFATNQLTVYLTAANGSLAEPKVTTLETSLSLVSAIDLNGDGKPELIATAQGKSSLYILPNEGAGKFSVPVIVNLSAIPYGVLVADLNGDHQPDLLTSSPTNAPELLLNNGAGGFSVAKTILNRGTTSIITGDFNKDGKIDLAFTQNTSALNYLANLVIAFGDGAGDFPTTVPYAFGKLSSGLFAADFNQDGFSDLLGLDSGVPGFSLLWGAANGSFLTGKFTAALNNNLVGKVSSGDLNNDGIADIVGTGSTAFFYEGQGNGLFKTPQVFDYNFKLGGQNTGSVIADINKDGRPDVVIAGNYYFPGATTTTGSVTVLAGSATGFQAAVAKAYPVGLNPLAIIVADFNVDGWLDVATANAGANTVSILLNDKQGNFLPAVNITTGLLPASLAAADFNSDSIPDLIVANRNSAGISLLLGDGSGGFTASLLGIAANPRSVMALDVNGDGKQDVVILQENNGVITVLPGNGNGTFAARINNLIGERAFDYVTTDFNRDGKPDLVLTQYAAPNSLGDETQNRISLYYGDGTGHFFYGMEFSSANPRFLTLLDFTGNPFPDLIATNPNGIQTYPALCQPLPSAALVVSVNSASYTGIDVAPNGIVSAFGTDLSSSVLVASTLPLPSRLGNTEVKVKDSKGVERTAALFFVSPTQVNYQIPGDTARGLAIITIINGALKTSSGGVLITNVKPGLFTANADGSGVLAANALRVLYQTKQQVNEPVARYDDVLKRYVAVPVALPYQVDKSDTLYLILYGTGIRARSALSQAKIIIDGKLAVVEYAGPHCCFVGVDQINVRVDNLPLTRSEVDVKVEVDGKLSNTGKVTFQ